MKTQLAALLLISGFSTIIQAREWVDQKGLVISANVIGLNAGIVHLRLAGGKVLQVPRTKLSTNDQSLLARFDTHRATANRLRIVVNQAMSDGALGQVFLVRSVQRVKNIQVGTSKFDGKAITEQRLVTEDELTLVSDNAFVDGLDTATDGEAIDFIGWRDGMFSYEAVSGAKKSVMKFTLTPPEGMVSVKAEEFGR